MPDTYRTASSKTRHRRSEAHAPAEGPPWPVTPDGRYLVVRGRLWRRTNPHLGAAERETHVRELMAARRGMAKRDLSAADRAELRARVDAAKRALGERGPIWWQDGAPDLNRHMARNTLYADWFASLDA